MAKGRYTGFLVGLCVGAVVVANRKAILKSAVKASIVSSAELKMTTARCAEDLTDLIEEARYEASQCPRNVRWVSSSGGSVD